MKIQVNVKTPPGQANATHKKLRPFLIGIPRKRVECEVAINQTDDLIVWTVDAPIRDCMRIQKNVTRYDMIISAIFNNKKFKKYVLGKLGPEDQAQLRYMLTNQTEVSVTQLSF